MPRTPPFRTNPSTIARYFFHDCERFLYFSAADPSRRQRAGIPTPQFDRSPLVAAILHTGHQWEREVVEQLLAGRVVVAPGTGDLHTRRLSVAQTLACLRDEPAGRYLYQPTLSPPPLFYQHYDIDPKLVVLSDNHPDLVAILPTADGRRLLRVVDLKRGQALKLTHRVQILLYALELQALLEAEGITSARVDLDRAAVWLGQQPEPEEFDLAAFRPHLERFLRSDLSRILGGAAQDAHWHLYPRCEWCEFFAHCRAEMRDTDDVSRLAQLTVTAKRHLRGQAQVQNLTQLGKFLKRPAADEVLERCASLAGQRHRLQLRVQALQDEQPQVYGAASPDLPRGENIALHLTVQQEPLGQAIYLAGVLVTLRADLRQQVFAAPLAARLASPTGKPEPCVWLAASPSAVPEVRRQLIETLHALLQQVHDYNQRQAQWKDQLTLQAYVQTEEERALLCRCLLEALQEPTLAERAMVLLFHFQGPELLLADRHPGNEVAYPVVVLQEATARLLALPVEVSATLPETLEALHSPYSYPRKDYFHFPLGHGMRAEAIHAVWYAGQADNLDELRRQTRLYLFAVHALLRSVRELTASCLVAWPPRFQLPAGTGIRDPLLSRLAFFARYESLVRCRAVRDARAEARPTQVLTGEVIELAARADGGLEVVGDLVVEPEAGGFPAWLLVRDTDEGRRAQLEFADYGYRNKAYGGQGHPHRALVGVQRVLNPSPGRWQLLLKYAQPFQGNPPEEGERFLLYPRFTDYTTDPVVKFLLQLDQSSAPHTAPSPLAKEGVKGKASRGLFLDLLRNPEQAAAPLPLPKPVAAALKKTASQLAFTPSQQAAFQAIAGQRATAVWGPPGTGKTHFLAASIAALAAAHAQAGKPFRVLVTAFTHAAIENLLRKLAVHLTTHPTPHCSLALAKAKYWQSQPAGIEALPEDDLADWLGAEAHAVLGATVFSCLKARPELPPFDLVVIDEASQVRVPEAAVAISSTSATGRLVLAGDHLQLPPIIAGTYPEPPAGTPLLHRSIFEAVCPRPEPSSALPAQSSRLLQQLQHNFRMNDVLTSVAGQLLYGPSYQCATPAVAQRRLAFKPKAKLDALVQACLDPAFPLVLAILDGPHAAKANPLEADLVAQLVVALREGLRAANGKPYTDDAEFFRHGVFVVSPHHAQIRAIQRDLAERRRWQSPPFVDTVDKMQGQEAEAVIVSYGVADPEFALREAEFIYGLNRLNVAITRARTKSIVCLPRPLLEAAPAVLDVEAAAQGLAFMRRLVQAVETAGEPLVFEGEAAEARLLRLAQPLR